MQVRAETFEGKFPLSKKIVGLFNHLPAYETINVDVVEVPGTEVAPAADESGPTTRFRVQCLFMSALSFETLRAGFVKHIAGGNLVSNADRHNEYVAFVDLESVSAEGLEDAAHALLVRAFGAEVPKTEEQREIAKISGHDPTKDFQPITTKVL